jgi:hypothetical protein
LNILASEEAILNDGLPYRTLCGIYFLINEGEIVYVGQAADIHSRIAAHARDGKTFTAYSFVECKPSELSDLEAEYIVAFAPRLNQKLPPNANWCSLRQLRMHASELGIFANEVDRFLRENQIQAVNGYYRVIDFRPLVGMWYPVERVIAGDVEARR